VEKEKYVRGPKIIHPEEPSAIGSRNSLNRGGRNEYREASLIIDEEIDKVLNHISAKLPPEVLSRLDITGGVKDKLHNYFNQNLQNMQNRYLVTVEDELLKKYHDLIDREEHKQLNRYTALNIAELMDRIGGIDRFNTAAIERSLVSIYEHLQGHLQRGVQEFEHNTNALLRQKNDVGSFIRRENGYAIIKCSVKNNSLKPKTVFDVKLAINILDAELLSPIHHYQKPLRTLLQEIVADHVQRLIENNIDRVNGERLNNGETELTGDETFREKLQSLENYLAFNEDPNDENGRRYDFIAKHLFDSLKVEDGDIDQGSEKDQYIREGIQRIIEREDIKNRGFNRIINALTTILDNAKMGYRHIDNQKNARVCVIREYAIKDRQDLPDEAFSLRLSYFDTEQLNCLREAYDQQFARISQEVDKAGQVVDSIYSEHRREHNIGSFAEIARNALQGDRQVQKKGWRFWKQTPAEVDATPAEEDTLWNELGFAYPTASEMGTADTFQNLSQRLKKQLRLIRRQVLLMYGTQYPEERLILEKRLTFLEEKFQEFAAMINPHHVQQGIVLEVDITSVKRRQTTMHAMSDVLNEFLVQVSRGFVDQSTIGHTEAALAEGEKRETRFTSILRDMDRSLEEVEV
jgi:hypothetical protein